jgi:hypothetical protein
MTGKDAAMFPIIASCTLFGIYIIFQVSITNLVCNIIAGNAFIVLVHLSKLYRDNLLKTFFFNFYFFFSIFNDNTDSTIHLPVHNKTLRLDCDYDKQNISMVICDTDISSWLTKSWCILYNTNLSTLKSIYNVLSILMQL